MLAIVVFLICIAHRSEADPMLWGSRIRILLARRGNLFEMDIRKGQCYVEDEVWGSPCQMDERSVNVTLNDVLKQSELRLYSGDSLYSTVFFVPNCTFQKPGKDEVDLKTSFPLSRFLRGQTHVELKFAAQGAESESWAFFYINGDLACYWEGRTIIRSERSFCRDLTQDTQSDLRVFVVTITRDYKDENSTFQWSTLYSKLVVTVDWMQEGE
ncbi:diagnostic antigen gp50 [Echinococcus multilocularis]|uniref:Diagnostic antigen gp50 n=1 Tax=Echinococcus multilocularis TaxID=6211 RepID=A0A087VWT9_ECHMU|nr:diagnostic antigen gp50 [Echinococcus multilocularis]